MPSDGLPGWAKEPQSPPVVPQAAPVEETKPAAAMGMADITEPSPLLPAEERPKSISAKKPTSAPAPEPESEPDEATELANIGLVIALVALILVGVAVVASQFPYGRIIAAVIAMIGLVGGIASLGAEGRAKQAGGLAIGLHALILLVVVLLPSWLHLDPWRGAEVDDGPQGPVAKDHQLGRVQPLSKDEWIDASRFSWEFKDIRVTVRSAHVGPVEVLGPKDSKRTPKDQYFNLRLRVVNSGVEREITLSGWATGQGAEAVRVIDPAGRALKPASFEDQWQPDRGKPLDRLFPDNSSEPRLIFTAPVPKVEWLRVQLPGSVLGLPTEEIKFQIGSGFLARNAAP